MNKIFNAGYIALILGTLFIGYCASCHADTSITDSEAGYDQAAYDACMDSAETDVVCE